MADPVTPPFVMHGARDAIAAGFSHIEQQVESIERSVSENPGLSFDLARTLVESTCRTVLKDRSVSYSDNDDLPKLFRSATNFLTFLPETASDDAKARKSLEKMLAGMNTTIQGLCELRNQHGFASHGSDGPRPTMERVQALLAAEAADAIIGFLHRVHQQDRTPSPELTFEKNETFNDHVDESFGSVVVFDLEFRPSEVMFQMEPESYRIYLAEFGGKSDESSAPIDKETQP